MKTSDFDKMVCRCDTGCRKWDTLKETFGTNELLPFWIADMDFKAPPGVIAALQAKVNHGVFGYHALSEAYYRSVIDWLQRRHGWCVSADWVLQAPGVVPSISMAVLALTGPGDHIIIQPPVYPPFFSCITKNGRKLIENPLVFRNGRYEIDFNDLEQKITPKVKMLILCSPHNPVGRVWTQDELKQLGEFCCKHNLIILSDEIHSDLVFHKHSHIPLASLSPEISQNVVTFVSPSKSFNIAGLYTSFIVVHDKQKRQKIHDLMDALAIGHGNSLGVSAAAAAYNEGEDWLSELLAYLEANADFLADFINEKIPAIGVTKPEGTYLAWLDFRTLFADSASLRNFLIRKAGVGLNDGATFGTQGLGFARLNFGCPRSQLEAGLEKIKEAVNKL